MRGCSAGKGGSSGDSGKESSTGGTEAGGSDAGKDASDASNKCIAANCPGFQGIAAGCCLPDDTCGYDGSALGLGCVSQQDIQNILEGGLDVQVPDDASDPNCDDFTLGGFTLQFGPREYKFSGSIELIRGMSLVGSGGAGWYGGTTLIFPPGVHGIVCYFVDSAPSATPGSAQTSPGLPGPA